MRIKCTYDDCDQSFATEKGMRRHKIDDDEHDYCPKCDEDFKSIDDYVEHKISRPDMHNKACRICGEEFKSTAGLRGHIEYHHKVNQKLRCIGCQETFYRACLLIEHLEFGHCKVITASQFQGHIVHKHLIAELLKGGAAWTRFQQKTSKFEAAHGDYEEEGGVKLDEPFDDLKRVKQVGFKAIEPEVVDTPVTFPAADPFPPLSRSRNVSSAASDISSAVGKLSLSEISGSGTMVGSRRWSVKSTSTTGQPKVWGSRDGKSTSNVLFPNAPPTPAPSEFSIAAHDDRMEQEHGINIMRTRFWDPMSTDWNPERFFDSVVNKYHCPFVCEQTFYIPSDLDKHIMHDHRMTRMQCPMCLRYFKHTTALMAHCEGQASSCGISQADDYGIFLDRLSGGFLGVTDKIRPDHLHNPSVMVNNPETGAVERYRAPAASYLQYAATKPPDWKEPEVKTTVGQQW